MIASPSQTFDASPLAKRYENAGLSLVPVERTKKPPRWCLWKSRQTEAVPTSQIERELSRDSVVGVAAVCGKVSGGLLILDFDEPGFYEAWREKVGDKADGLPVQRTGSGGYQVGVRCDDPGRNVGLAYVPDADSESGRRVAIETRGEGGYAVVPGSLHPSGNFYEDVGDCPWTQIPHRDQATVDHLLQCARDLCRCPKTKQQRIAEAKRAKPRKRTGLNGLASVIDAFNEAHHIEDVLLAHGYTRFGDRFTRPGEDASPGGVVILNGRSFHHSTNDPLRDPDHTHDAFDVYAFYEHDGDMGAAVKAAAQKLGISHTKAAGPDGATPDPDSCDEPSSRLIMRCAADVQTRRVNWLWDKRFVAGAINMLIGMPDVGKGVLTCDMAARISNGAAWPPIKGQQAENQQGSVVFLSMEDSPETTIVPRLRAAGANLRKIHIIEAVERIDFERNTKFRDAFDISRDIAELEAVRKQLDDLRFVVIDPLDSYLNAKLDTGIGNKVRAALWPLKDWAEATGVTVLIVHHFNKTASTNAMDRVSGARSFGALPRSVWMAARDEDFDRTILMPAKLNLVKREDKIPLSYNLKSCIANPDAPVVSWRDEDIDMTTEELLGATRGGSRVEEAADWLRDVLRDGPIDSKTMQAMAEDAGQSWSTVKRAKAEARVVVEQSRKDGRIVGWMWRLEAQPPASRVQNVGLLGLVGPLGLVGQEDQEGQGDQGDQGGQGGFPDEIEGIPI